jgi:hypothetical protein
MKLQSPYQASITTRNFFTDGIRRLVNCYTICVEERGDYVEKCTLHLSQIVVHEVINKIHFTFWLCLVIWICICNETAFMSNQFTHTYPFRCEWHKFCCKQFSWVCNIYLNNYWAVLINKGTHYKFSDCALMVFYCRKYWYLHLHQFFGMIHPEDNYASTLSHMVYMSSCLRLWTSGTFYSFSYHKPKCKMTLIWSNPRNKTSPHQKKYLLLISYT